MRRYPISGLVRRSILVSSVCVVSLIPPRMLIAEVKLQGYSGLNHFVPRQSRTVLYKAHAFRTREHAELGALGELEQTADFRRLAEVGECSINIGNSYQEDSRTNFYDRAPTVIVHGDVVNVGRCQR